MRYILARILGLLNREVATYQELIAEMRRERNALFARDLPALRKCLENQQQLVDEIYDLKRDFREERRLLLRRAGIPPRRGRLGSDRLRRMLGTEAARVDELETTLQQLVADAKLLNRENRRIVQISHAFFRSYINSLSEMRSRVFGYKENGYPDESLSKNFILNQQS